MNEDEMTSQSYKYIGGLLCGQHNQFGGNNVNSGSCVGKDIPLLQRTPGNHILNNRYHNNASNLMTDFGWIANSGGVSLHTRFLIYLKQISLKTGRYL